MSIHVVVSLDVTEKSRQKFTPERKRRRKRNAFITSCLILKYKKYLPNRDVLGSKKSGLGRARVVPCRGLSGIARVLKVGLVLKCEVKKHHLENFHR